MVSPLGRRRPPSGVVKIEVKSGKGILGRTSYWGYFSPDQPGLLYHQTPEFLEKRLNSIVICQDGLYYKSGNGQVWKSVQIPETSAVSIIQVNYFTRLVQVNRSFGPPEDLLLVPVTIFDILFPSPPTPRGMMEGGRP